MVRSLLTPHTVYNTLLAIVPALALLFAIGRGFGFQNLLQSQLFTFFPSQENALRAALGFVDHYLAQASQGVFVGVGLVFLLWTMISLMGNYGEYRSTHLHCSKATTHAAARPGTIRTG